MSDYVTTGDGLIAALQLLAVARQRQESISRITHLYEPLPQVKKNIPVDRARLDDESVRAAIAAAENRLGTSGRLVVRPSGTEPTVRLMAEGEDVTLLQQIIEEVTAAF